MKHHTEDYKITAVKYYLENNEDMRDTCEIFKCKFQSLSRWIERYKKHGNIIRKTRKNHNLKITPEIEKFVKEYIRKYPTTTLWEFSKLINEKYNIHLTDRSVYNILNKHKITRKRLRNKYYPEKREGHEKEDLEKFYKTLNAYDYKRTICLDETSIYLNMTLTYGRSKSGTRVIKKTNKYPYKRYNLLCAICADKVVGWILYENMKGGIKTNNIIEFYDEFIKDKYKNHLIIMDNAVIHRSKIIKEHIEDTKNELLYSVPYHPETNAIEEFFNQLKHYIKKESPNTYKDIDTTIKEIIKNKIKKEHLTNYLKHSYKIYKS
uniref:Tc1-like transposase DDE domain-containing protein n=1 Tax=viral metagenome TaxID=1070528 RepID=A0A6C0D7R9_9ZZZZ